MPVPFGVQCSKRLSADERDGRAGMLDKVDALFARLEEVMAFQAIRQGLILTIPVLLVGSFCLIFLNLPLEPYQDALAGAPHIEGLLNFVYNATMGIFSLYVAVAVALRYANACAALALTGAFRYT